MKPTDKDRQIARLIRESAAGQPWHYHEDMIAEALAAVRDEANRATAIACVTAYAISKGIAPSEVDGLIREARRYPDVYTATAAILRAGGVL